MQKSIKEQLKGKRILVATIPGDGHFNPLTGLAKYLQNAGADIRWYTSDIYGPRLEKMNIQLYPIISADNINGTNIDEYYPERKFITDVGAKANFDMVMFSQLSVGYLKDITLIRTKFPFDLVIADSLISAIPLIKATLRIPVIAIGVIPLAEQSIDTAPFGPGLPPPANELESNAYSEMWEYFNNIVLKESIEKFSVILKANGIPPATSYLFDTLIRHADLYLQIGTPSFEY